MQELHAVQFKLDTAALLDSSPKKVVNNSLCGLHHARVWPCYAIALVECHKITCPTPQNMGIDIKTDDLAHFWDLATVALAADFLIFAMILLYLNNMT